MIEIREVETDQFEALGHVIARAWQEGYRDLLPADFLARMSADERAEMMRRIVQHGVHQLRIATHHDRVVGMVVYGPYRDEPALGEVVALNVDPAAWGGGVGGALLEHATGALARDYQEARLWALVGNDRAGLFYEKRGWERQGVTKTDDWWGTILEDELFAKKLR